jgi:hypothetical protein
MTQKQQRFISDCLRAATLFRIAFDACDREAKAKNDKARRKARGDAEYLSFVFFSYIYQAEGDLRKALHVIADALVGKPPHYCRPPNDKFEDAIAAIFGGKNDVRYLMKAPFPFRRFKQELARLYGVTPKELTKKTQRERDRAKNRTEEEELKKTSVTTHRKYFDSYLRRTLKRRGYTVSGKSGAPKKSPRLMAE